MQPNYPNMLGEKSDTIDNPWGPDGQSTTNAKNAFNAHKAGFVAKLTLFLMTLGGAAMTEPGQALVNDVRKMPTNGLPDIPQKLRNAKAYLSELRGLSPSEIPDLEKQIRDYYEAHNTEGRNDPHNDLSRLSNIITNASNISKKHEGSLPADMIVRADAVPKTLAEEARRLLKDVFTDVLSPEADASKNMGDPSLDLPRYNRFATYRLVGTARNIENGLREDMNISGEMEREALLLGIQRCFNLWDPGQGPLYESPSYNALVRNIAFLVRETPNPRASIDEVLKQIPADAATKARLLNDIMIAIGEMKIQYPHHQRQEPEGNLLSQK